MNKLIPLSRKWGSLIKQIPGQFPNLIRDILLREGAAIFLPAHLKEAQMLRPPLHPCLQESCKVTILMQIIGFQAGNYPFLFYWDEQDFLHTSNAKENNFIFFLGDVHWKTNPQKRWNIAWCREGLEQPLRAGWSCVNAVPGLKNFKLKGKERGKK